MPFFFLVCANKANICCSFLWHHSSVTVWLTGNIPQARTGPVIANKIQAWNVSETLLNLKLQLCLQYREKQASNMIWLVCDWLTEGIYWDWSMIWLHNFSVQMHLWSLQFGTQVANSVIFHCILFFYSMSHHFPSIVALKINSVDCTIPLVKIFSMCFLWQFMPVLCEYTEVNNIQPCKQLWGYRRLHIFKFTILI